MASILILGLGNVGEDYIDTRHNVGFMNILYILDSLNIKPIFDKYLKAHIAKVKISSLSNNLFKDQKLATKEDSELIFALPTTYMNLSGESFKLLIDRFNFKNKFVIYDDIDTRIGNVNFKNSGGAGGHNGLKSILSVDSDFIRVKIGVGANIFLSYANIKSEKSIFIDNLKKRYSLSPIFSKASFFNVCLDSAANKEDFKMDLINFRSFSKSAGIDLVKFVLDKFNPSELIALPPIFEYIKSVILLHSKNSEINLNNFSVNLK